MQMTFNDIEIQQKQVKIKELAVNLERRFKAVAHGIERHLLATLNDKSYSYISEILNTNNEAQQKPFQIALIPSLIIEAPDVFMKEVWNPMAELCDHEPSPGKKKNLCAEEELALLKKKITEHGLEKIFDI